MFTRYERIWLKKHRSLYMTLLLFFFIAGAVIGNYIFTTTGYLIDQKRENKQIEKEQYRILERQEFCDNFNYFEIEINDEKNVICPKKLKNIEPEKSQNVQEMPLSGKASYYSVDGCIGCNENRIMANGEVLDDKKMTLAYNYLPLNSNVKVTNIKNKKSVVSKITDRGGFERHGKIADLSLATKNALGCGDVCFIEIEKLP